MQFGDEMEVLYLIAPTEEEKKLWMYKLEQGLTVYSPHNYITLCLILIKSSMQLLKSKVMKC